MKLWWINLARATKRRAAMERQLADLGLDGERIEAVTTSDLTAAQKAEYCNSNRFRWLSETELACSLSHARALRHIAGSGEPFGVVLEDDAVLSRRLPDFLAAVEAQRPAIDLIRLESTPDPLHVDPRPAAAIEGLALRRVFSRSTGSAAYIASATAAAMIAAADDLLRLPADLALFSPYDPLGRRLEVRHADPALARQYRFITPEIGAIEHTTVVGSLGLREGGAVAPLPVWLDQLYRLRRSFDREIRRGIPKTVDTLLSGARKRIIAFEPEQGAGPNRPV